MLDLIEISGFRFSEDHLGVMSQKLDLYRND